MSESVKLLLKARKNIRFAREYNMTTAAWESLDEALSLLDELEEVMSMPKKKKKSKKKMGY